MATVSDLDVFARVVDGKIVEYPVYRLHIVNRGHPLDWYTPVVESPKPDLPEFSNYKPNLSVVGGTVVITYTVIPQTLDEILRALAINVGDGQPGQPLVQQAPSITDVPPATVEKVYDLVGDYTMDRLTTWAKTRKYGSFTNLTDYRDSAIPKFKAEALRGLELRDQIWATLIDYFTKVTTGQLPVPISISEIDALIPPLLWPDETAPSVPTDSAPAIDQPTTPIVHAPTILFPTEGSSVATNFTAVTTSFASDDANDSFSMLVWEASPDPAFSANNVSGSSAQPQTFDVGGLVTGTTYFLRAAYVGAILGQSPWSATVSLTVSS